MTIAPAFTKGLHEVGDGAFAYLQPTGTWCQSNAGLIVADDRSLLVDTLFDLGHTQDMLDEMAPITVSRPIEALVNTHGDGDHCFGNELVPDRATIYATVAAAEDMERGLVQIREMSSGAIPPGTKEVLGAMFDEFDTTDVQGRAPDTTFTARHDLEVGERVVHLIDLGPAHTHSDTIAFDPAARVVYTGDLVFVKGTPLTHTGPVEGWIKACEAICALDVDVVVPGHGAVTDKRGVRDVRRYWEYVRAESDKRQDAGMDCVATAFDIDLGEFADWGDAERLVMNIDVRFAERDPQHERMASADAFSAMARYKRERG